MGIDEIVTLARSQWDNDYFLRGIRDELKHRHSHKAKEFLVEVKRRIAALAEQKKSE